MKRRLFQWFTAALIVLSVWTAYANVFSDDTDVRAKARLALGCGGDCRLEGMRGERGMLEERIEYDVIGRGHYVVVCRRPYIAFGDHACEVVEGKSPAPPPGPASALAAPPAGSARR